VATGITVVVEVVVVRVVGKVVDTVIVVTGAAAVTVAIMDVRERTEVKTHRNVTYLEWHQCKSKRLNTEQPQSREMHKREWTTR
jgi:hypothetical protein